MTGRTFRSVAEIHTLFMPNTRQNDYDTAFKLHIFAACKPVQHICEKVEFFFKFSGCGVYTGLLNRQKFTVLLQVPLLLLVLLLQER